MHRNSLQSIAEKLSRELEGIFAPETVVRFVAESYDNLAATAQGRSPRCSWCAHTTQGDPWPLGC